jgi:CcmD family protein
MATLSRLLLAAVILVACAGPVAFAQTAQPPAPQSEYVPINQLPAQDQLPAAPLLVAAYSFVMLMLFTYVLSVARRLTAVDQEVKRLEADLKRGTRT